MGILKRAWDASGWIIGGYTVWKQLQTLSSAKDDLFQNLSPDQQAQWIKVFGDPGVAKQVQSPSLPQVAQHPTTVSVPTQLTQVRAGT